MCVVRINKTSYSTGFSRSCSTTFDVEVSRLLCIPCEYWRATGHINCMQVYEAKGISWLVHCRVFNSCTHQTVVYFACFLLRSLKFTLRTQRRCLRQRRCLPHQHHTHKHTCKHTHSLVEICCWHLPSNKQQTFMLLKNERRIEKILNTSLPYNIRWHWLSVCACVCESVLYVLCMCVRAKHKHFSMDTFVALCVD